MMRSQDGSDGLGTLTDRVVFTRKSKQYYFVLPKVLARSIQKTIHEENQQVVA